MHERAGRFEPVLVLPLGRSEVEQIEGREHGRQRSQTPADDDEPIDDRPTSGDRDRRRSAVAGRAASSLDDTAARWHTAHVSATWTTGVSDRWRSWRQAVDLDEYDTRWDRLAAEGHDVHGEADAVERLGGGRVLDAGCGTGRVAIELARRGHEVVGVDADADLLAHGHVDARRS